MTKTLLRTNGVWDVVAQMGGGWAIGIATAGTDAEILGAGRVEWVAAGAIQVNTTSWDVKASSYPSRIGGYGGRYARPYKIIHAPLRRLLCQTT